MSGTEYTTEDGTYESGVLFEEAPLAYGFDADTREYLRSEPCQLDALETQAQNKAVWLLPAHATLTPPPEAQDGKARVWDGTAWQQVEDHRGTAYWLPSKGDDWQSPAREMAALGPLPKGAVTERPIPPVPTLEEAKATKLAAINTAADKAIAMFTATYPDREIATFDKQEAEARAHATNPTAPTPLLSALSQARGVPLDELARRVLVKADAFAVASGSIIGQRQALEDRLDACTTVEEVEALAVTITMPGAEVGA